MDISAVSNFYNDMIKLGVDSTKREIKTEGFEKSLKKAYDEKDKKALKKACQEFEQIFLNFMYRQMRATIMRSDLIENSFALRTFEEMFDESIAGEVARGRGVGLADMLYIELSKEIDSKYKPAGDR